LFHHERLASRTVRARLFSRDSFSYSYVCGHSGPPQKPMENGNKSRVLGILIDTCVWLDLAKDYQQQPILTALEELIRQGDISLLLPRTIVDEFARNKSRVIEDSGRSLSGTL